MKIAYLGIDLLIPVLHALLREGCTIQKIFTCPTDNVTEFNTAVMETARIHNIPYTMERITAGDIAHLQEDGCEMLVCAGYYYRVPVSETLPMVNFHPSSLPVGRGSWPMPIIILRGLSVGGITAHKMDRDFDTGDILIQERFPINPKENHQTYMDKVYARIPDMVHRLVTNLPVLLKNAQPQGEGDYWPAPTAADWTITPEMGAEQADLILRAFYGYECIYLSENHRTELIGGRFISGDNAGREFPVRDGYIVADKVRNLSI